MMDRTRMIVAGQGLYAMRVGSTSVIQGVRRDGRTDVTARDVRDALALVYPDAVFTGWTAAALHGASYTGGRPPEIWLPQIRSRKGVVIRSGVLLPEDVEYVLNRRATVGALTAIDIARRTTGDEAVAGFDLCLRADRFGRSVTTREEVLTYLDTHPGLHRSRRVLEVLRESCSGSDSPWETYSRLAVHRSGLRLFAAQVPVPETGYRVDLGSAEYRIAIEYDGEYHRSIIQQRKDIARWNAITGLGWSIIRVTTTTLTDDLSTFIARIETELRRRGWIGPTPTVPQLHLPAPRRMAS